MRVFWKRMHFSYGRKTWVTGGILFAGFMAISFCLCAATRKSVLSDVTGSVSVSQAASNQISTKRANNDIDDSKTVTTGDQTRSNTTENTKQSFSVQPEASQIVTDNDRGNTIDCDDLMSSAVSDFNHEVADKKSNLDSSIKFPPVPANISIGYIQSFNNTITDLFNEYVTSASKQHCTWPIKSPPVLPLSYPNS